MDYVLTEHARDAMEKRQIQREWIERALRMTEVTEADLIDPHLEHRLVRIEELENRVLRVIVNCRVTPLRVVTAFIDRRRTIP